MAAGRFGFSARLERVRTLYAVSIPASVSRAIGVRGPVPIVATVNGIAEVRASLVPAGGGRHQLRLNTTTRRQVGAEVGDRLDVELAVDENPVADPTPRDLAAALREADLAAVFDRMPVGKRNHIIQWIEKAAAPATRAKRIRESLDSAARKSEKEHEMATRKTEAPAVPPSFAPVVAAFAKNKAVSLEKGWGAGNLVLKVQKKIFAMTIKSDLVAKLPKHRVAELVEDGVGKPFDPRKNGRVMKEWIVVPPKAADWIELAHEAFAFVKKGGA